MKEADAAGLELQLESMPFWVRENPGAILRNETSVLWTLQEFLSRLKFKGGILNRTVKRGQRVHESVVGRVLDETLRPPYASLATVDSLPEDPIAEFRKLIDNRSLIENPQSKQEWIEEWGFDEPAEEEIEAIDGKRTVMIEIPSDLAPKVEELITAYAGASNKTEDSVNSGLSV